MSQIKLPFWRAVGIIFSMIVGSGIFTLPYAVHISGIWWSVVFGTLAFFAVLSIHIAYGEVVANTREIHRLPGYTKLYLGKFFGYLERLSQFLGFNTALLIYGTLGGVFLSIIFGGSAVFWTIIFFAAGSTIFFFGNVERISLVNIVLAIPLILAIGYISFLSFSHGTLKNLPLTGSDPFFSFSVFVFSLTGLSVIADAKELLRNEGEDEVSRASELKSAITLGTVIPLILYVTFVISVLMALGSGVTRDALSGLVHVLGRKVVFIGGIIGVLATFSSYLALGYDLKEIYELDARLNKNISWFLVLLVPVLLFLLAKENFVTLISIVGGFFVSIDGLMVILILRKMRANKESKIHFLEFGTTYQLCLAAIFMVSMIYEFIYQIF